MRKTAVAAALKAVPGARGGYAPQSSGMGRISPVAANALYGNPYRGSYGPFMPRPSNIFTDGAFGPMSPIQPVPTDEPPAGGQYPDPRWWQYPVGWNLPTPPGTEGLKLSSFQNLKILSERYSVARACIDMRQQEIRGLEWEITLTKHAAKAYQGSHSAMKDFGERAAEATRFFRRPDPDYWNFTAFLNAVLEEIFVYDALALVFRPKYGAKFGRGGRGLLGSDLDSMRLVSGPTIRPLVDMHGGHPAPPAPSYQQYLYGVPRSDYLTIMRGDDLMDGALDGAQVGEFTSDLMLYAPYWPRRETPYGFPPVERALLPIISGLQKQEFQLDYFTEGCYSSDTEILTRNGWKLFTDLSENDEVATRNDKGDFEWQIPSARLEYPFDGEMVEFSSKSVDLLVTPGHRMLVSRPHAYLAKHAPRDGEDGWHVRLAEHIARAPETRWIYPVTSSWRGAEPGVITIPGIASPKHPARDFHCETRAFAAFLGIFLAEGWVRADRDDILVAQQETSRHFRDIREILDGTGLNWSYLQSNQRFCVTNKALANWLRQNCGKSAAEKKVPREMLDCSARTLEALLSAAMMGDGHWGPLGQRYYTTTSPQLADDMQEVFQKLGRDAWIRRESGKDYPGRFGKAESKKPVFVVRERLQDYHWLPKPKHTEYHGTVHCVTVDNGIVYVRRNGKAAWCGNTTPAVYISPGDPNITPTQIRELQDALNGVAGDPAYHLKVIVLPPGSKVEPQRPIDLSDSFDLLVQTQVTMAFDIQPMELGILPLVSGAGGGGAPSAMAARMGVQEVRDIKSRKSTKPLLQWLCAIFDYVLQDICGQKDMRFQFEGLADDEDKQAITELGVQQVQNGIASIDEVRDRLDLAPWGLQETSEPVVFTAQGPVPFSMAPQLLLASMQNAQGGGQGGGKKNGSQGTNSGQRTANSQTTTRQPRVRQGGQTLPNGTHPAALSPHRESLTPGHSAAQGAIQSPTPRTGGTTSRSSVAGSRKKAVASELDALRRHLRKGRLISTWHPEHITPDVLQAIAGDLGSGTLIDVAVARAADVCLTKDESGTWRYPDENAQLHAPEASKAQRQWPGWERDLGLVGAYQNLVAKAFREAQSKGEELRKAAADGKMYVSRSTLNSLVSEKVRETLAGTLEPLWREAWHLGYAAGEALATGKEADFSVRRAGGHLEGFIGSEGAHWLEKISRTGLKDQESRSEMIARTEVARAMNAGAIAAYRDHGVTHKHLLLGPGGIDDQCQKAADEGVIPLDAIYPGGGPPFHPRCRCISAPAGTELEPPQGHLGKHADAPDYPDSGVEDEGRLAWLLLRARDEDGRYRFLLQQRDDGTWGMPGGSAHIGEDPWHAALRESTEEIGALPALAPVATFHHVEEDGKAAYLYLCECDYFRPRLNGSTPDETRGTGWFRKKEIDGLRLTPKFREDWEESIRLRDHVAKALQRMVNENGEELFLTGPAQELQAVGSRWPYPRRGDESEWPDGPYGSNAGEMGASEPPGWRDMTDVTGQTRIYPRGDEDEKFPPRRGRGKPAKKFPPQGERRWPDTSTGGPQSGTQDLSAPTGTAPSVSRIPSLRAGVKGQGGTLRPVVGSEPAVTPKPDEPHAEEPEEPYDPALSVPVLTPWGNAFRSPENKGRGGPSDYSDPNPVHWEIVYNQLARNFPPQAIAWVKRARWAGPVNIPWERVDSRDIEEWAASHQPGHVEAFARQIRAHQGHVAPSVVIQDDDSPKAIIVDGHHRALARRKLGMPVLSYLGLIDPRDRQAAEETHSAQVHGGSDPKNR